MGEKTRKVIDSLHIDSKEVEQFKNTFSVLEKHIENANTELQETESMYVLNLTEEGYIFIERRIIANIDLDKNVLKI